MLPGASGSGFLGEISKLPPEQQTQRIAKVLAAMRGDV